MFESCFSKQEEVKKLFSGASSQEEKYQVIIDLGKRQRLLLPQEKSEDALVSGCQSRMWLKATLQAGCSFFQTESDALISAGLGQILCLIYSGEEPDVVIKCPPLCLEEMHIVANLTPGRANGLASLLLRMRQEALKHLVLC
jgi:cysteine desulfuration protein SufE